MANSLHFRSFIKFLGRNRLYMAINVFGLSVSLMFVILIAVYTVQELSVDKFHANRGRIYAIGNENYIGSAYGLVPYMLGRYPEIDKITATRNDQAVVKIMGTLHDANIMTVDSTFFDIFSFRMIEGDAGAILRTQTDAIVSEDYARKTFGNTNPIGQTIIINEDLPMVVAGVAENFRNSSFSQADIIMNLELVETHFNDFVSKNNLYNAGGTVTFIMTHQGADLAQKIPDMEEYFKEFYWIYSQGLTKKVTLTPLDDLYFSKTGLGQVRYNKGDLTMVVILISVGLLILLFAIINYINLTVAQTGFRAKEMATRRLLGASRGEIFSKFIIESILACTIAFAIGFLLALAFQNAAGDILGRRLDVRESMTGSTVAAYALMIVVMGVVSGLIPAIFISRYKPMDVVKGSFRLRSKMVFSKVFIVFQNVITISLIAVSLTILLQIRHMIEAPMGYNTENIVYIPNHSFRTSDMITTFLNELKQLASVEQVSLTRGTPFDRGNNSTANYGDKNISFQVFVADSAYFRMLGFEVLKDNKLSTSEGYWLNETAAFELGLGNEETDFMFGNERMPVLGIVKDFRIGSVLKSEPTPALIYIIPDYNIPNQGFFYPWQFLVKIQGDPEVALKDVQNIHDRLTGLEFHGRYMQDMINDEYAPQRRIYKIVTIFTFIAILISALGLLAMSTYFIQQRASEIAIRKVFGSTRGEVLRWLIFNYLQLVAIAFLLAVPVIWLAMRRWLSDYSYRITLSPWIFIAAGGFALLIAFMTVLWQSSRAANANPTDSIKN